MSRIPTVHQHRGDPKSFVFNRAVEYVLNVVEFATTIRCFVIEARVNDLALLQDSRTHSSPNRCPSPDRQRCHCIAIDYSLAAVVFIEPRIVRHQITVRGLNQVNLDLLL